MTRTIPLNWTCDVVYQCRDIGYGVERGETAGYFTGEVDTWGKHTLRTLNGPDLYLFEDEILEITPRRDEAAIH